LCGYFAAKSSWIHVIDESALAVDLHDRKPLPVPGLELRVASDVDFVELEVDLLPGVSEDLPRPLAQVATLRVVEDDPTDKCRG
jgi:hypothetical protein